MKTHWRIKKQSQTEALYKNKNSEEKNLHFYVHRSQEHSEQTRSFQKRYALHCPYCTGEKQRVPGQGWGAIIAAQLLFVNHPALDNGVNPSHLSVWFRKKLPKKIKCSFYSRTLFQIDTTKRRNIYIGYRMVFSLSKVNLSCESHLWEMTEYLPLGSLQWNG